MPLPGQGRDALDRPEACPDAAGQPLGQRISPLAQALLRCPLAPPGLGQRHRGVSAEGKQLLATLAPVADTVFESPEPRALRRDEEKEAALVEVLPRLGLRLDGADLAVGQHGPCTPSIAAIPPYIPPILWARQGAPWDLWSKEMRLTG